MLEVWNMAPVVPPQKIFKPKFGLPNLASYAGDAPKWFWDLFPSNLVCPAPPLIDVTKLESLARECGYPDQARLDRVVERLTFGASIGCEGKYRAPSRAKNSKSAIIDGYQVTDEIASWIHQGFAFGPIDIDQVPAHAKVNSIMTRPKPNGSVRIILNLSAPAGLSVNDGIDIAKFPTTMSSTTEWLRVLNRVGKGAWIAKIDWSSAYKHFHVKTEDTDLQYFFWLGKAFKELCLIFGSSSSPGIFDDGAKVVLFIIIIISMFCRDWLIQHLDDVAAAVPAHLKHKLEKFDATFQEIAVDLGIQLAPRDDKEKSFGPSKQGVILGVWYDTDQWVWGIPGEKLHRLRALLQSVLDVVEVKQEVLWTIVGKLIHVRPLVPGGKFHMDYLLRANSVSEDPGFLVPVTADMKSQLWFWYSALPLCSGATLIPDPDRPIAPWALQVFTDASGGSFSDPWRGVGAVTNGWWAFLPWGRAINSGMTTSRNRSLARVMSALELVGPLLVLCAGPELVMNNEVQIWVDNAASVCIWEKGYSSSCDLSSTLVKAMYALSSSLGCRLHISKITRCSVPMASMADALSKGAFLRFWGLAAQEQLVFPQTMPLVPTALMDWVNAPSDDPHLGKKLIEELILTHPLLPLTV